MAHPVDEARHIDEGLAELTGEGSLQRAEPRPEEHLQQQTPNPWPLVPTVAGNNPTYYDRPVLKQSVWAVDIPLYYFVGGLAGAALTLGAAAQLRGDRQLDQFIRRCHWLGVIGSSIGGVLLVQDLGRPSRFLNMMRVFRPTSPMNMGVWILSAAAPLGIGASFFVREGGVLEDFGEFLGLASGVFGAMLATYTGVLVSNTVIPFHQETRRWTPVMFGCSAMASAASMLDLLPECCGGPGITFWYGMAGRVGEIASGRMLERAAGANASRVAEPLRSGATGAMWRASAAMTIGSLVLSVLPGKSRSRRAAASVLGLCGSLLVRLAIHYAGKRSAAEPRATFELQRADQQFTATVE